MTRFYRFLARLYANRSVITAMAAHEVSSRYAGTFAGFLWSVVNPIITVAVYWLVFSVGFRVQPVGGVPFIVVFSAGLIPWMTFSECMILGANSVVANSHLVTKMVFPTEILPVINLAASLIIHCIMLGILLALLFFNGIKFSLLNLQFFYYLFALSVFSLGLSWFFAAINVFYRDTGQVLGVILNVWFWLTPIAWVIDMLPERLRPFMRLNPMFYIVDGYQNSFIYGKPFWQDYGMGAYFWGVSLMFFVAGGFVFRKLKSEFADVL
ncbi:MAG: ABC transporter permease [Deltaproteobacteria bacterium]|nr:ABC transporter permease [Deltaproteobacteria bacterium]